MRTIMCIDGARAMMTDGAYVVRDWVGDVRVGRRYMPYDDGDCVREEALVCSRITMNDLRDVYIVTPVTISTCFANNSYDVAEPAQWVTVHSLVLGERDVELDPMHDFTFSSYFEENAYGSFDIDDDTWTYGFRADFVGLYKMCKKGDVKSALSDFAYEIKCVYGDEVNFIF